MKEADLRRESSRLDGKDLVDIGVELTLIALPEPYVGDSTRCSPTRCRVTDFESGAGAITGMTDSREAGRGLAALTSIIASRPPAMQHRRLLHLGRRKRSTRVRAIPIGNAPMNTLIVTYQRGRYYLVTGDNNAGVLLVDDDTVVQILAQSMRGGLGEVVANSEYIFANDLNEYLISSIFSSAEQLFVEDQIVYWAAATGSLLEEIVEAGAALALWLG